MMGYYETLDKMLKKSGLTLQEVAVRCERDFGVKINRSYISKLKTVRQSPASDEINEAIAKVCGGNVEEFLYEAYLEKAPDFMKTFIKNLLQITREMSLFVLKDKLQSEQIPILEAHFNQLSDLELVKEINNYRESLSEFRIQKIEEIQNRGYSKSSNKIFDITMKDSSMEPTIPKGAIIHIDREANITTGDIVVVLLDNVDYQIRRYYPNIEEYYEGEDYQIIFTSDNPTKEPISVNASEVQLLGKVTSFTSTEKV